MPVPLTTSKYSGTISAIGTTTATNSAATFIQSDFDAQRIVGLWNSAGVYKGMAWVRRWVSSTQLELEAAFIDKTGATVAQTTTDTYKISSRWADVATTGIAVSGKYVSLTDTIIFGTAGSSNSLCFYDEDVIINADPGAGKEAFDFRGGLCVFGHLGSFASRSFVKGCYLLIKGNGSGQYGGNIFKITNSAAKVWWLGGSILAEQGSTRIIGHDSDTVSPCVPAEWQKYWGLSINTDICSPNSGTAWASNAADQEVANIVSSVSLDYAINLRWANGTIKGGTFKLAGSVAISIFGADATGTYVIGAAAGQFINVLDNGFGNRTALWRSNSNVTQTINYTNLIALNRKHGWNVDPGSNPSSATGNFFFSGLYANLISGTLGLVKNNGLLSTVQDSGAESGTGNLTLTVKEAAVTGHTETVTENAWAYAFHKYGYILVAGTFATSTVDRGTAGIAKTVVFGGFVGQIFDINISQLTASTVAAYVTLGTFDQLYDYAQYYKALNTANAIYPSVSNQLVSSAGGVLGTLIAHNLIIDSAAAAAFSVNTTTQTITIKPLTDIASGVKADTFNLSPGKTLTFVQGGDKSGAIYSIPATGILLVPPVPSVPVNLTKSIFASGSTINRIGATGTAIVTVDASQLANITAGAGVTVQAPLVFVSAPNFAQNTRVQVARLEPYSVPSTAIATATNIITISGNRFKSAAPATLVYFQLQAGAILPTTSPQIANNTLYFVQAAGVADGLAAGQFKLSLTQGGAAIVFSTQGSGNFTLTGITELDNSLVGASGYSVAFAEPNNTLLRVSAQFWQNATGCTATNFYQQNIIWNSTSGNAIADTVSVSASPDTVHNFLIGNATRVFNTNVTLPSDGSTIAGISFNAQGTISLDPRLFTSVAGFPVLTPQAAYLYTIYYRSTAAGIRVIGNQFSAQDSANFTLAGLRLDNIADGIRNTPNTPAMIAGGYIGTVDGSNPISPISGAIYLNADRRGVLVTTTSGSTISPTQQQLRDAQALAPSAGVVAATGSIDSKVDEIKTNTAGGDYVVL